MYELTTNGATVFADKVTFVKLANNGCYVPCDEAVAEGFCAKTPIEQEDGTEASVDTVYRLADGLTGAEPLGSYRAVSGAALLKSAEERSAIYEEALANLGALPL